MTKLRYRFFFIFTILNINVSLIFYAIKSAEKISSGSGEEVDFGVFPFFVIVAITDSRPDPILQF